MPLLLLLPPPPPRAALPSSFSLFAERRCRFFARFPDSPLDSPESSKVSDPSSASEPLSPSPPPPPRRRRRLRLRAALEGDAAAASADDDDEVDAPRPCPAAARLRAFFDLPLGTFALLADAERARFFFAAAFFAFAAAFATSSFAFAFAFFAFAAAFATRSASFARAFARFCAAISLAVGPFFAVFVALSVGLDTKRGAGLRVRTLDSGISVSPTWLCDASSLIMRLSFFALDAAFAACFSASADIARLRLHGNLRRECAGEGAGECTAVRLRQRRAPRAARAAVWERGHSQDRGKLHDAAYVAAAEKKKNW